MSHGRGGVGSDGMLFLLPYYSPIGCLLHTTDGLAYLTSLVSGTENWREKVEQQEGVKGSSFHAQHLAFGGEYGILLWTEGMLWKAARFEAVSPVCQQENWLPGKVDPVTRNTG